MSDEPLRLAEGMTPAVRARTAYADAGLRSLADHCYQTLIPGQKMGE